MIHTWFMPTAHEDLGNALLHAAQLIAPECRFWDVSVDPWDDGSGRLSVFIDGRREIEVVLCSTTSSRQYHRLILAELDDGFVDEQRAERVQMGITN